MAHDFDVVIVGGGPAGISTALFLLMLAPELRSRLIVLEKHCFPREKFCAGAVAGRADALLASIGVHVDVPSVEMAGMSLKLPLATVEARAARVGRVVRRIEFDERLARIAMARGVRIEEAVEVKGLTFARDAVQVSTGAGVLRAQVVIGADGVGSVVRRCLGPSGDVWRAQVLEVDTEVTSSDSEDTLHFDFEDQTYAGYGWDFPTLVHGRRMMCRGLYQLLLPQQRAPLDLDARLSRHLAKLGLSLADCKRKRYAERGYSPGAPLSRPRVLLAGEAAGIDPVTGEGIAQALQYGECVARYLAPRVAAGQLLFPDWQRHFSRTRLGRRPARALRIVSALLWARPLVLHALVCGAPAGYPPVCAVLRRLTRRQDRARSGRVRPRHRAVARARPAPAAGARVRRHSRGLGFCSFWTFHLPPCGIFLK